MKRKVEIEKRFRRSLSKRFNHRYARNGWAGGKEINISCSLCHEFRINGNCRECPFAKFQGACDFNKGCLVWIEGIMGKKWVDVFGLDDGGIFWSKDVNKEAIELLKKLREKATKYIVWVENK